MNFFRRRKNRRTRTASSRIFTRNGRMSFELLEDRRLLATLTVPGDAATISGAVALAVDAQNTITISAGTYNESVDVSAGGGSITFIGVGSVTVNGAAAPDGTFFNSSPETANFTFDNLTITKTDTSGNDNGIFLSEVTGTVQVLNSTFTNIDDIPIAIVGVNNSSTDVLISGNTHTDGSPASQAAIRLNSTNTSTINASVVDNMITNGQNCIDLEPDDASQMNVTILGNTLTGTASASPIDAGIQSAGDTAKLKLTVVGNTISNADGDGLTLVVTADPTAAITAVIQDNDFTSIGSGTNDGAIRIAGGNGRDSNITASIVGNRFGTVAVGSGEIFDTAIEILSSTSPGTYNISIANNMFLDAAAGGTLPAVTATTGNASSTINLDMHGNTIDANFNRDGYSLDQTSGGVLEVIDFNGNGSTGNTAQGEVTDNNTYSAGQTHYSQTGTITYNVGANPGFAALIPVLLGDFVWDDDGSGGGVAGDGRQNGSEPGIEGVRVGLTGAATATTFTDENGNYFFSVLPGGYTVTVTPPAGLNFSPKDAPGGANTMDTIDSDFDTGTGQASVTISAGQDDLTIDAGLNAPVFADLSITKADSADPVNAGAGFSYSLAVSNAGPSTATSLSVSDTLPAGVGFVSASGTGWACGEAAGVVTCTRASLSVGAAPAITINVTAPNEGGGITNTATVSAGSTDNNAANDSDMETTSITAIADLSITKTDSADPVSAGASFSYSLAVSNAGPSTATSLSVSDTLPAGVGFVSAAGTGWACGEAAGVVTCTRASLSVGAAPAITINVTAPVSTGNITNTATISAATTDNNAANDSDMETTAITQPPGFDKVFAPDTIAGGGISTLTFTIDNTAGLQAATALDFTDNLPAAVTVASPANASTTCTGGTLTATSGTSVISYSGGTVAMAASCTVQVDVTSSTAGTHVNTSGDLTSSLGNSGTANDSLTVEPPPTFAKLFAPDSIISGGISTLTFTIDNSASALAASLLDFTDNLPAGVVVATPPAASTTCTGGVLTAAAGSSVISYTGGSVAAGASCTVQADVTSSVGGAHVNTTGDLNSSNGNSGTASDTLNVTGIDFGDAPDATGGLATGNPYPTLLEHNGARHALVGAFLGASIDDEADGQPDGTATGDDTDGNDDEDGVTFTSALVPGTMATLDVVTSGAGLLNAWIDFNDNGSWADPGEQIFTDFSLGAGANPGLTYSVPFVAPTAQTFARFRFDQGGGLSYDGQAPDGEVEDYEVAISACSTTVTSTSDNGAVGTLRYAIQCANATPGVDTIDFNIAAGGVQTIAPLTNLPAITEQATVDATTQPGFAGTPLIKIDGALNLGLNGVGLRVNSDADGTIIRGFNIVGMFDKAIFISRADNTRIEANFIGTDPTGAAADPNGNSTGIYIVNGAGNTVGGNSAAQSNVIGGNFIGVTITGGNAINNIVSGNFIGTDVSGTLGIGNTTTGVLVSHASGNTIGGTTSSEANVISANINGVEIRGANTSGNKVQGNLIGTDATGAVALGNRFGVVIRNNPQSNTIGGDRATGEGNVISGNLFDGVYINNANLNMVQGNAIGSDAAGGSTTLGNTRDGVEIAGTAQNNLIGGTSANVGNLISGNGHYGVKIISDSNQVQGNRIGVDLAGAAALGNGRGGVLINSGAGNTIGGANAGASPPGNQIAGNSAAGAGIMIQGTSQNNVVQGNLIGTNAAGAGPLPNLVGVRIRTGGMGNTIGGDQTSGEGNVISGNASDGINIRDTNGTDILGNRIGVTADGTADLGNGDDGVDVVNSQNINVGGAGQGQGNVISGNTAVGVKIFSDGVTVKANRIGTDAAGATAIANDVGVLITGAGNTIGGDQTAGEGNQISGNTEAGAQIQSATATGNAVRGNLIGTDAAGGSGVANKFGVLIIDAPANTIGGAAAGDGNTISGNSLHGVFLQGAGATGNQVQGNRIGTNLAGVAALPNAASGVLIDGAPANTIGGAAPGAGNVISGNTLDGVKISGGAATGNQILGNAVGADAVGTTAIANRNGVLIADGAAGNSVGDGTAAGSNTIANNAARGVWINANAGAGNTVTHNAIRDNAGLGIALAGAGVLANDAGDADAGANDQQNYPVLTSAISSGGTTTIEGSLNSAAGSMFTVEFFSSPTADPSGFGEGATFVGTTMVTTDAGGNVSFSPAFAVAVPIGQVITATATNAAGSTSEFSAAVTTMSMLQAAGGELSPAISDQSPALTRDELLPIVDAAIERLSAVGFSADLFDHIEVTIADLPGATLGAATADSITIDINAAGHGWFVDATPLDDVKFGGRAEVETQQSILNARRHIDLLTAVMHELGHAADLHDLYEPDATDDLMYWSLEPGVRKTSLEASMADEAFAHI